MKKIKLFAIMSFLSFFGLSQSKVGIINKNKKGIITSVEFSNSIEKNKIPISADTFFDEYLEIGSNDQFEKVQHKSKRKEFVHDHFDQYYKGIKIDGAGYNLHYKNGQMYFANGNYIKIDNINTQPSIKLEEAITVFLQYKNIDKNKVRNNITELIIKELANSSNDTVDKDRVVLVYRIYLESEDLNNDEIGYINAHSGKIEMTEPRLIHGTGTFATRYSGNRQAETDPISGGHRLFDDTRGADIHTRNLQNNSMTLSSAIELVDNDNNWTNAEHGINNNDMGLDVH